MAPHATQTTYIIVHRIFIAINLLWRHRQAAKWTEKESTHTFGCHKYGTNLSLFHVVRAYCMHMHVHTRALRRASKQHHIMCICSMFLRRQRMCENVRVLVFIMHMILRAWVAQICWVRERFLLCALPFGRVKHCRLFTQSQRSVITWITIVAPARVAFTHCYYM